MTDTSGSAGNPSEPVPDAGVEEIRADIEETRAALGETVAALTDKMDVKGRAEDKVHEKVADAKVAVARTKHVVTENARAYPAVPWVAAAVVAVLLGGVVVFRRRRGRR
jgi:cytochrome oxidase assembly protein ShyY1